MDNLKGVPFKRKNSIESDMFIVDSIENEYVTFTNSARCSIKTLQSDFERVDGQIVENITSNAGELDPNSFFDTPLASDGLVNKLETVINNPNAVLSPNSNHRNSVDISSNPLANRMYDDQPNIAVPTDGPSWIGSGANQSIPVDVVPTPTNTLPEYAVFDRVKKALEIEITIPFTIKLPYAEKIDALNDMFETSFVSYLAKQYIKENIINNYIALHKSIQQGIEQWMEAELYGSKSKVKKTKSNYKSKKSEVVEKIEPKVQEIQEPVSDDMFRPKPPVWSGDISKLIMIQTQEQYDAIKTKRDNLIISKLNEAEADRLSEMMDIYEQQIQSDTTNE